MRSAEHGTVNVGSSLYVYNKIDSISIDFLDKLAREPHTVVMSCELDLGVQDVVDRVWQELRLIRVYTKRLVLHTSSKFLQKLFRP
jgi:ribosome-interacting GTPase 1